MKTSWFRVAVSGKTIDGREITPAQIDQMASSYKPATYGARIWVEHLRSLLPDSPFKAHGDVLGLKAEDAGDGKRALLAQVDATEDLMSLSAKRQKVYWSIEMDPAFAGTGQAYMVGLAVTDSPASTGTEMLKFSLGKPDSLPEAVKGHLFGEHVEGTVTADDSKPEVNIFTKVKEMLTGQGKADTARFAALEQAVSAIAEEVGSMKTTVAGFSAGGGQPDAGLAGKIEKLSGDLTALTTKLETTGALPQRPKSDGNGHTFTATDC